MSIRSAYRANRSRAGVARPLVISRVGWSRPMLRMAIWRTGALMPLRVIMSSCTLTAVGAAAILAEAGDPSRYDSSSSLVKHAGLSPSDNASGAFHGEAHISRRGRPGLRLTVWRAVWPMLQFNPVMAAKYQAMTAAADQAAAGARDDGAGQAGHASAAADAARRRRAKARVACAAALLRWIYSLVVHGTSWDPDVAAGRKDHQAAPRYLEAA